MKKMKGTGPYKVWTFRELHILKKMYPNSPKEDILEALPLRTWSGIAGKAQRMELKRSPEIYGLNARKKKGDWVMPADGVVGRPFKKGHKPKHAAPIGTYRFTVKNGRRTLMYKVGEGRWIRASRHLWERENGPIPEGMILTNRIGRTGIWPEDCEVVTKGEIARRNQNHKKRLKTHEYQKMKEAYAFGF